MPIIFMSPLWPDLYIIHLDLSLVDPDLSVFIIALQVIQENQYLLG